MSAWAPGRDFERKPSAATASERTKSRSESTNAPANALAICAERSGEFHETLRFNSAVLTTGWTLTRPSNSFGVACKPSSPMTVVAISLIRERRQRLGRLDSALKDERVENRQRGSRRIR